LELDFEVRVHPIEEHIPADLPAQYAAAYLSKLKADAFPGELQENELLITADTVVIDRGKVLGKPATEQEAFEMLKDEAQVTFRFLDEEEIFHYLKKYQPYDKAGSYGIQEWIGFVGVSTITGSYFTVMGFPLHLVYAQLKKWI